MKGKIDKFIMKIQNFFIIKAPINKLESQGDILEADICNIYN